MKKRAVSGNGQRRPTPEKARVQEPRNHIHLSENAKAKQENENENESPNEKKLQSRVCGNNVDCIRARAILSWPYQQKQ